MKKQLILMILLSTQINLFANPIIFETPRMGDSVFKRIKIQIQPPLIPTLVRVWIRDVEKGNRILWRGQLTPENNYTLSPNISRLNIGAYHIEAVYYMQNKEVRGNVVFWVDEKINF